jgi:hypothetical protein
MPRVVATDDDIVQNLAQYREKKGETDHVDWKIALLLFSFPSCLPTFRKRPTLEELVERGFNL